MSASIFVVDDEPDVADLSERRRRADELGASEFLTKPVDFDFLKQHLRQLPTTSALEAPH